MANHYESLIILKANLNDEEIKASIDKLKTVIANNGGNIIKEENWGTKELSYVIKKQIRGRYFLLVFTAEPSVVGNYESTCNVMENMLKYVVIRLDKARIDAYEKKAAQAAEAAKPKAEAAAEEAAGEAAVEQA
ncbi:MAG: 30S ribosomal protein S6 [Nitrospirae bacterium]|nr:30S ribosomal protein S6 [Nitrospirota bacterium]